MVLQRAGLNQQVHDVANTYRPGLEVHGDNVLEYLSRAAQQKIAGYLDHACRLAQLRAQRDQKEGGPKKKPRLTREDVRMATQAMQR